MSKFLTLNIGASKATLAEYSLAGGRLSLNAYGIAPLPQFDADAASSMDATLTPAIHSIMRDKGIKPAPLLLSLGGQMVFIRSAKFPAAEPDKLEQLVRYEIEQNVPFPIDEIIADHQFLGTAGDGETSAMIVAAKHDQVTAVTDAVKSAGLKPAIVDVAPMAVYNALMAAYPGLDGCNVVLDIGAKSTNLILVEGTKIYNRSIPVAGNNITKDIAQTFGCSFEEAEQLKIERGYVSLGGVTEDEDEVADRVSKVIRTVLTRINAEISRSINFYRSQQGGGAPARLFLTGGSARLGRIDEFFTESLQIEVLYLNPFQTMSFGSKIDQSELEYDAFALAESAGLALRRSGGAVMKVNLMPLELIREEQARKRIPFLVAGAAMFLVALGLALFAQYCATDVARAETDAVNERTGKLRSFDDKLKTAQKAMRSEIGECDDFAKLIHSRSDALRRIRAVQDSLVPGMWIVEWAPFTAKEAKDSRGRSTTSPREGVRVTIRGWSDVLAKAEDEYAKSRETRSTSAEIVQAALKTKQAIVADTVKIVRQDDVKGCLMEFSISMEFAPSPSLSALFEKEDRS